MKALPLLALLLALPAFADDWPQKGDTVFVAADLHQRIPGVIVFSGPAILSKGPVVSDVSACSPLVRSWAANRYKDQDGRLHILAGDWSPYLTPTLAACREAVALRGVPAVSTKGVRHTLAD